MQGRNHRADAAPHRGRAEPVPASPLGLPRRGVCQSLVLFTVLAIAGVSLSACKMNPASPDPVHGQQVSGTSTADPGLHAAAACQAEAARHGAGNSYRATSLYHGPAPRPGPPILYRKPAVAPQLTNSGIWHAPPILVSGTSAYRCGEFLYQDYLYDDHGADGDIRDPNDPRLGKQTFAQPNGTYTYPTGPGYNGNAADLVEFRVKPLAHATAFRVTLNTLINPSLVGFTIAIGSSPVPRSFPYGANVQAPARWFLTVHGHDATLLNAATGKPAPVAPTVSVDMTRRQFEVRVPHADWNPGTGTVRMAMGVGLWNAGSNSYLIPQQAATATRPGGAGDLSSPPAFFNVAFRYHEPLPDVTSPATTAADPAWWADQAQGQALRSGNISRFYAMVDFARLERHVWDDMHGQPDGVPTHGPMDRILASHFETRQGVDYTTPCGSTSATPRTCLGELRGQLQPYAIYVPDEPRPAGGWGLTLLLHSLSANYNQYQGSRNQSQLGNRGKGSIVITPEGRGPNGWYFDYAGADAFEVWADVAKHYRLNPSRTVITGYSMGGYGTFKFATRYPDLFARAQTTVGPPALGIWVPPATATGGEDTNTYYQLASLRNVPILMWVQATDELVPYAGTKKQADGLDQLGYRYEFDTFAPGEHLTLSINDQYAPVARFLTGAVVNRNPAHVTYVVNPKMDQSRVGLVGEHAYWVSGLTLRNASGSAPRGTIDVRSAGFGKGDPTPGATQYSAGTLTGGTLPALAYTRQYKRWGPVPTRPAADVLRIKASNIATMTVNVQRAQLNCDATLDVTTDGPLRVTLAGCQRTLQFPAGTTSQ